jgi:hypothetical protein
VLPRPSAFITRNNTRVVPLARESIVGGQTSRVVVAFRRVKGPRIAPTRRIVLGLN